MNKPKMIIFDYGQTLLCEPEFDTLRGEEALFKFVNENGIRSGVISNIGWSGEALASRINRLLPKNNFEFIIASSDYMFRNDCS